MARHPVRASVLSHSNGSPPMKFQIKSVFKKCFLTVALNSMEFGTLCFRAGTVAGVSEMPEDGVTHLGFCMLDLIYSLSDVSLAGLESVYTVWLLHYRFIIIQS